jgi:hypothetical protein
VLGALDRSRVVRAELALSDAAGKLLGTIGFCQDSARFDAPDGTFGGIKATRP